LAPELVKWADRLGLTGVAQGSYAAEDRLLEDVLDPDWRVIPAMFGGQVTSQMFGRIACEAGIEAIRYPSIRNPGHLCLAIFPQNFDHSNSYFELEDPGPDDPPSVIRRLDRHTWRDLV
jgi:hypothetical protein